MRRRAVVAGVVVLAALIALGCTLGLAQAPVRERIDPSAEMGQLANKTSEEVQAELDREVEEGMFGISIAAVVYFADGAAEGEVRIENVPSNRYNMQVSIALADGRSVYESGVIEPNHHIRSARLSESLPAGAYDAEAVFTALDRTSGEEVGRASAEIVIVIEE